MRSWIQYVVRHRKAVLFLTSLFTLLLLTQLRGLKVLIDPDSILPQDHHFVRTNDLIESTFGNKFTVVISLTSPNGSIYQTEFLKKVKTITENLAVAPGIIKTHLNGIASENVKTLTMTPEGPQLMPLLKEVPESEEAMEQFKQALHSDPLFKGLLYSEDEKTTQIVAEFAKIDGGFQAIQKNVEMAVLPQAEGLEVRISGLPIFLSVLESFSARMAFLFPLALLLIGLIHYEAFRTKQALILPLVTALLAVVWSVGILGLLRQSFDVFNASTPILILAIAAGHAVQILKRYYEEYHSLQRANENLTPQEVNLLAVEETLTKVGPVMITACVVAALGFFSLTIFEIKTVRTFGLFTGFGVLSSLVIELTFIPALRAMLPPPGEKEKQRERQQTIWDCITDLFYRLATKNPKEIFIISSLFVLAFLVGATRVKIDNSQKGYFADSLQIKKDDDFINNKMSGTNLIYVLIDGKQESSLSHEEVIQGMAKTQDFLDKQPLVGKTISIVNFVKRLNQITTNNSTEEYRLPDDKSTTEDILEVLTSPATSADLGPWINSDKSKAVIATFIKTDSSAYIERLAASTKEYAQSVMPEGVSVGIGGGAVNGVALNEVLIREKILNIAQILLAVFLVTALVFRSFMAGVLILVPLIAALVVNFGIMGLFGIPLQIATALVSAMAVGIGADYGIYMSYRMREELRKGGSEKEALKKAFDSAGKATLFVSSAVAGGFGILMLSWGFYIHIWMGFLISTAMVTSSIAALTIFPALVFQIKPRFIFEKR